MRGHRKNYRYAGGKQLLLWCLLGFLALSCYLLLPLVFYYNLAIFSPSASEEDPEDYVLIIWSDPKKPRSRHNGSGPLCQAEDTVQDYACSTLPEAPDGASLAQPFVLGDSHRPISCLPLPVSGPRAPPLSI